VPAADSGLGSGITNVSLQISGALGLAVLSTIAANRTKGLVSAHHGLTSSLISGYHVAFLAGAGVIATGIVLAFVLLRPARSQQQELQLAAAAENNTTPLPANFDLERNAA
jgi:hypothetical protein